MKIENEIDDIINDLIPKEIAHEIVFFDIETSGLSATSAEIFLAGMVAFKGHQFVMYQYFSENSNNEIDLLTYISDMFKTKKYIFTYNGNAFDIHFYLILSFDNR